MIGIIGSGNMGKAIASRMDSGVLVSDAVSAKLKFSGKPRVKAVKDNIELAKRSNIIILAVKPRDIKKVLLEIKPYAEKKLIISIAAGIKTIFIEKLLKNTRVVRVMPNMPALAGKGISAIARGKSASKKDVGAAVRIFLKIGETVLVKEDHMDVITALSGSGPAYYFLFTDMLAAAGSAAGLPKALAKKLAVATFIGAAESAAVAGISMRDFVKKVVSKGGTTEAALKVFKKKSLGRIVEQAVRSATKRSKELSN
ncbi:MAG: pyrroline-5-carboxylate reductase [Candidatus Omnitrophica bacterium]|nr:pyrroline-5-carboxylate reductase [Candidatus Omnitrophota bacterium]